MDYVEYHMKKNWEKIPKSAIKSYFFDVFQSQDYLKQVVLASKPWLPFFLMENLVSKIKTPLIGYSSLLSLIDMNKTTFIIGNCLNYLFGIV